MAAIESAALSSIHFRREDCIMNLKINKGPARRKPAASALRSAGQLDLWRQDGSSSMAEPRGDGRCSACNLVYLHRHGVIVATAPHYDAISKTMMRSVLYNAG